MPITKKGNVLMAVPLHIAQNKATQKMLSNKTMHKALWQKFYNGLTGNEHLSKDSAKLLYGLGPLIPEVKILGTEAGHLGSQLAPHIKALPGTKGHPDLRTLAMLRRAAKGRMDVLTRRPLKEHEIEALSSTFSKFVPSKSPEEVKNILRSITPEKAHALQKLVDENPLTNKLLKGVVANSNKPSPTVASRNTIKDATAAKVYGYPAEAATAVGLGVLDPTTLAVNTGKRVLFSHDLGKKIPAMGKLQNFANELITNKPIKSAINSGTPKNESYIRKLYKRKINPDVVNPLNAYALDFAEGIGNIKKM